MFEAMVHDLRAILRLAAGRNAQPSAAILDARTLQSSLESGSRAGYDVVMSQGVVALPGGNRYTPPLRWPQALNRGLDGNGVIVGFRPEAVTISPHGPLAASVYSVDLHGAYTMLVLEMGDDHSIHARVGRDAHFSVGETVRFDLIPTAVRFFDHRSERAIQP